VNPENSRIPARSARSPPAASASIQIGNSGGIIGIRSFSIHIWFGKFTSMFINV